MEPTFQPTVIDKTFKIGQSHDGPIQWTLELLKDKKCNLVKHKLRPNPSVFNQTPGRLNSLDDLWILEQIAESGQMIVFKALQKRAENAYVVKVPKLPSDIMSEHSIYRAAAELCDQGQITQTYEGVIEHNGKKYEVVVEQLLHCTLQEYITATKELKFQWTNLRFFECIQGLIQTFATLEKGHICHRDIKPANILVDSDLYSFRVIDFGCAEIIKGYVPGALREMTTVGTPGWAGPNVQKALDEKKSTVRIEPFCEDVQSLLKTLLEIDADKKAEPLIQFLRTAKSQKLNFTQLFDAFKKFDAHGEEARREDLADDYYQNREVLSKKLIENLQAKLIKKVLENPLLKKRYDEIIRESAALGFHNFYTSRLAEDLFKIDPKNPDYLENMARICIHDEKFEEGIKYGNEALKLDKNRLWANYRIASCMQNEREKYTRDQILKEIDKGIKNGSAAGNKEAIATGYFYKADYLVENGTITEAIAEMNKAIEVCPESIDLRLKKVQMFTRKGMIAETLQAYAEIMKKWPNDHYAYVMYAKLLVKEKKDYQGALKVYKDVLKNYSSAGLRKDFGDISRKEIEGYVKLLESETKPGKQVNHYDLMDEFYRIQDENIE